MMKEAMLQFYKGRGKGTSVQGQRKGTISEGYREGFNCTRT